MHRTGAPSVEGAFFIVIKRDFCAKLKIMVYFTLTEENMAKLYFTIVTLICFLTVPQISAQQASLPKGLTFGEKELITNYNFRSNRRTAPPASAVRTAAEWEEVEYLLVTWDPAYQNILRQIVAAGINECKVIISTEQQTEVTNYLISNGVPLTNVIFLNAPWNSIWTRDYSGNTVYSDDVGTRGLVDWIYNRPRPLDNIMPSAHAGQTGVPIYITDSGANDLVNTGGNFMSDGLGTAFASELILEENAAGNPYGVSTKSESEIDAIMESYMGITNYIKMPVLPYDGIHHIDMHMKLLDEETLLVSRYPEGVADGPQIEENIADVMSTHNSVFGTPYRIEWIDAPPSISGAYPDNGGAYRTFSNSVIVNGTIMVPLYRPEVDAPAIAKYQELMPGYTIVGIDVDNSPENLIASSGAIHCITHTIGVADPLLIVHQPVREAAAGTTVQIHADIKHATGISSAKVFWRKAGTANFAETAMLLMGNDEWSAEISLDADGTDAEYYIWAQANSGKSLTRPIVAPEGYWTISTETLSAGDWASKSISEPYPNPTAGSVTFTFDQIEGLMDVNIYNVLGQELYNNSVNSGEGTITLDLNTAWSGTLFVSFSGAFGNVTRKIIKL